MTAASGDPGDKPGYQAARQSSGAYPGAYPPPPEYGVPYPGGYGPSGPWPAPAASTNSLAVFSLVASIVGLPSCGLSSPIGIVFGLIALNQVKNTGQHGKGLAIAGIAIGAATLVMVVIWIILSLLASN